jgi:hypothetical protein
MSEVSKCLPEEHAPVRSTTQMLGSGGDYETVPVTKCQVCGVILAVHQGPDYCDDGEAD